MVFNTYSNRIHSKNNSSYTVFVGGSKFLNAAYISKCEHKILARTTVTISRTEIC